MTSSASRTTCGQLLRPEASTAHVTERLAGTLRSPPEAVDIRDRDAVDRIFAEHGKAIALVVHTAAQPSHDWPRAIPRRTSASTQRHPHLLESTRARCPRRPRLLLHQQGLRRHPQPPAARGARPAPELPSRTATTVDLDTSMSIDTAPTLCSASPRRRPTCSSRIGRLLRDADRCFRAAA